MERNVLLMDDTLKEQITQAGVGVYPRECCGILIGMEAPGGDRRVERLMSVGNGFEVSEQYHRFSITPRDLMEAERRAGEAGRLVLGFYHSHPDHPAQPSEYDREHAWPFYSYVIVAIEKGRPGIMTSWRLDEHGERFSEEMIGR